MMRVLAILLLAFFFQHYNALEQHLESLSKEDLQCIMDSQEESALGRWFQCLGPSSEESMEDNDLQNLTLEQDVLSSSQQPALESVEMSNNAVDTTGASSDAELETRPSSNTVAFDSSMDNVVPVFSEQNEIEIRITSSENNGDFEKTFDLSSTTAQKRWAEDNPLWGLMKGNILVLALVQVLLKIIRRRGSEKATKTEKEEPKNPSGVVFEMTIGAPLGSAVASVLAEVILSNSGCPLPVEKIYTLFEDSVKESLAEVGSGIECSKVAEDFLTSFKKRYASSYRIQKVLSASRYKENEGSKQLSSHSMEYESPLNLKQQSDYNIEKSVFESNEVNTFKATRVDRTLNSDCQENCMYLNSTPKKPIKSQEFLDRFQSDVFSELLLNSQNEHIVSTSNALKSSKSNARNSPCHHNCTTCTPGTKTGRLNSLKSSDHDDYSSSTPAVEKSNIFSLSDCAEENASASEGDAYEHVELQFMKSEPHVENVTVVSCADRMQSKTCTEYEAEYASSISDEIHDSKAVGELDVALVGHSYAPVPSNFQRDYLSFFERYVVAQEQQNHIRSVELVHMMKQQTLEQEKIQLSSVSNNLMRENIELSKTKASFKESTVLEEKERVAHMAFITTCADELGCGLFVMLVSMTYGAWKYSSSLLNNLMTIC